MFRVPKTPTLPEIRIGTDGKFQLDGGLNLLRQESMINFSQSPSLLNVNADNRGTLSKRNGIYNLIGGVVYPSDDLIPNDSLYPLSNIGDGACEAVIYKGKIIVRCETYLYSFDLDGTDQTTIYSGIANSKASFILFEGILYILNGTNFLQYNGTTVTTITPYIPIVSQGRKYDGSTTTLYEPLNLLTGGFIDMFSPLGSETTFTLSFKGLDATTVTANNNGTIINEGSGLTVNRTNGTVTFTTAPTAGTNTLKITAYKTNVTDALQILNCTRGVIFASRLFITGNPNYPNRLWKTGLSSNQSTVQANYFPASGYSSFDAVGGIDQAMTAFIKKYDKLIYLKEKSTYITAAETQSDGSVAFPINNVNDTIGCDMPGSVQLIDGNPVFCNSLNGLYMITSTTVLGENLLKPISDSINGNSLRPGLLQENINDLKNCSSFDDGKKYYLNVGGNTYVWDYSMGYNPNQPESLHWFKYDNITASNFFTINNITHYADKTIGRLCKFTDGLSDFNKPINASWKSKLIDFGYGEYYKDITDIWITTRENSDSTLQVNYYDDDGIIENAFSVGTASTKSFSWDDWDWDNFTWDSQKFAPTIHLRPGIKNVRYFQLELINNNLNEDLSLLNIIIKYRLTRKVR